MLKQQIISIYSQEVDMLVWSQVDGQFLPPFFTAIESYYLCWKDFVVARDAVMSL